MRIFVAQHNTTVGDFIGNTNALIRAIEKGKAHTCSLVVSSELALLGYPPNDLLNYSSFLKENEKALERICKASEGITVIVGALRKNEGKGKPLYNSAYVIENQKIIGVYDKWLLPTYDLFDERRFFEPGDRTLVFNHLGKKIGLTLCEDIWEESMNPLYPFNPLDNLAKEKPDLLINLSASPFELNKFQARVEVAKKAAKKVGCPLLYCNQIGGNDDLIFDGGSFLCNGEKLLDHASFFQEEDWEVTVPIHLSKEFHPLSTEEQLYKALVLGLRDFFHKQNFKKAILGLSGGIDSALVAVLAARALGPENVIALSMPSRFSSTASVDDAEELAKNLKIECRIIPIEPLHSSFLNLFEKEFKGLNEDLTEENIQSRIRGLILMAFSNKLSPLLLSCGNKSEMAMGYATLYGDLTGGLAPISDLKKSEVYALSHWINKNELVIPQNILTKAPSAELRPNQKDSDTLPDYQLLDEVIEKYMEKHMTPEAIAEKMALSPSFVTPLIQKLHKAEFKRRQAPLGLKVSPKAFSIGWRFPIVQKWSK